MVSRNIPQPKIEGISGAGEVLPGLRWWWFCWSLATLFCGYFEWLRLEAAIHSPAGTLSWFTDWNPETTLPLIVLLSLPLWILSRRHLNRAAQRPGVRVEGITVAVTGQQLLLLSLLLFAVSFCTSMSIGMRAVPILDGRSQKPVAFAELPPAYHDEFSYLLQARTFLAGRFSWPPMSVQPELFHQVHVLNSPRTASRYFPWTGIWIAPFDWLGYAVVGHWLAGSIACLFFFLSLARLLPLRNAFFAGLLIAVSPGIAVFGNLLLAHHPTMMMLAVFLWAFLKLMHSGSAFDAAIAGSALSLAMLGRPMTAAGFALPFGCWLLAWLLNPRTAESLRRRLLLASAMGTPLLLGVGFLLVMNYDITGSWTSTAYQYYTDHWTPRHRYGFDNVIRGAAMARDANVMDAYDRWATNLTPTEAVANVIRRFQFSVLWILGIVPVLIGLLMALPLLRQSPSAAGFRLLCCSVISLHALHVPYWYDGILHWHYVFETAPLLLLVCGSGLMQVVPAVACFAGPRVSLCWMIALTLSALIPGWLDSDLLWGRSKVSMAVSEQSFSRVRMYHFQQLVKSPEIRRPCLILVDETGTDPQISYIINPPDLNSDVLVCRRPTTEAALSDLRQAFFDRAFYIFHPQTFELMPLVTGDSHAARSATW